MTIPLTLAGLGGLQVLLLDGNRVADVGALSPLAGLERLRWLWLDPATAAGMGVKLAFGPNVEMSLEFDRRENGIEAPGHAMPLNGSLRR